MLSFVEKYFVSHHYLRGINGFVFAFIGRDFKRLGDRFDAGQDMGDGGFQSNPSGTHQPHSVLEMPKSTDVRKDPTQAALAQQVDVDFERLAEPGDPDKLAARADSVNSLGQCLASGKSLLRAAAGAFKDHDGAISPRQLPDDRSEEHTSELQSRLHLVCRLLLEKKKAERASDRQHQSI